MKKLIALVTVAAFAVAFAPSMTSATPVTPNINMCTHCILQ